MYKIDLDKDIQPLSKFRSNVSYYFDQVKQTKRPLVITQNGKSSAVLLNVSEYQRMVDKLEILEEIELAESQVEQGKGIPHSEVKKKFTKR